MIDLQCDCLLVRPFPDLALDDEGIIGGGDVSFVSEQCEGMAEEEDGLCDPCRWHCGKSLEELKEELDRVEGEPAPMVHAIHMAETRGWRWERASQHETKVQEEVR